MVRKRKLPQQEIRWHLSQKLLLKLLPQRKLPQRQQQQQQQQMMMMMQQQQQQQMAMGMHGGCGNGGFNNGAGMAMRHMGGGGAMGGMGGAQQAFKRKREDGLSPVPGLASSGADEDEDAW